MTTATTLETRAASADPSVARRRQEAVRLLRAGVYNRVSTRKQDEEGTSLLTQEERNRAFVAARGWALDEAHVYREVFTGAELWDRPELTKLRRAIRDRAIDVLVCYAIDRLSRDPVHLGVVLSEAEHAGATVVFVTEPLDDSSEGQLIRFVRGYAAKIEREKIKERSIRGKRARAESGQRLAGCKPPLGYRWDPERKGHLIEDPTTSWIVRRVFAESARGAPLARITGDLNRDGVRPPRAKPGEVDKRWAYTSLHYILRNPLYKGLSVAYRNYETKAAGRGRITVRRRPESEWVRLPSETAPALVEPATWDQVQHRLDTNRQRSERSRHPKRDALLRAGFVFCGHCGAPMRVNRNERGAQYRCDGMARCDGNRRFPVCGQHGHQISAKEVDAAAWNLVERILTTPRLVAAQVARLTEQDPTEAELASLDRSLREVGRQEGNIADAVAMMDDNPSATETLLQRLTMLADQRKALQDERERVLGQYAAWVAALKRLDSLEDYCRRVAANLGDLSYEDKRDALDALGVRVTVHRKDADAPRFTIAANLEVAPEANLSPPTTTASKSSTPSSTATRRPTRRRSTG